MYYRMYCELCDKTISTTNRSHHLKTKKHWEKDPDGVIPLNKRGRPKTKNDSDQTTKPKTIHVKNEPKPVTLKELLSQAKEYNLKEYTKWKKQKLITFLNKAKKLLLKKMTYKTYKRRTDKCC